MLSSIILKEAYRHRYTSRRSTFVEYVDKYTKVWNAKSADEKATLEDELYTYYKAVEFLVLEEVGKEIDSKVSAPILEDLLRYREDNGLVTIVCTNLNISLMTERYGESCISLLKGNTTPVMIECEDKRATILKRGEQLMGQLNTGLLSTPDGNNYFYEPRDYIEYIREKCGYSVADYVEENLVDPSEDELAIDADELAYEIDKLFNEEFEMRRHRDSFHPALHPIQKCRLYNKAKKILEQADALARKILGD